MKVHFTTIIVCGKSSDKKINKDAKIQCDCVKNGRNITFRISVISIFELFLFIYFT